MHLEFALDLSDIDLWDIDLSDTDFVDAYISSKHFVCLQNFFKTSSRQVFKTSGKTTWKTKNHYAEEVFKMCSRHVLKTKKCWCWVVTKSNSQIKWKRIRTQVCERKGNDLANKHISSTLKLDFVKPRVGY